MQTVEIVGLIIKGVIAMSFGIITFHVKGMNKSLRVIELDINQIKVEMSVTGANMINLKDRMNSIEREQREQLKAWIAHTDKYGAGLELAKRQAEKL